jgi:Fe-S protein assembly co-chaperone HscB
VNNAYKILSDGLERGIYILKISNFAKAIDDDNQVEDLEFLAYIMELNEKLMELDNLNDLRAFEAEISKEINKRVVELNTAFNKNDLDSAFGLIKTLRYFKNIQESLNNLELKLKINE